MTLNINTDGAVTPEEEARVWLSCHRSGAMTPEDKVNFEAWYTRSTENKEMYDSLKAISEEIESLSGEMLEEMYVEELHAEAEQYERRKFFKRVAGLAASFLFVLIGSLSLYMSSDHTVVSDYTTGRGEKRMIKLADGTRLHLNTDTVIRTSASDSLREVNILKGEVFLEVARDETRPFVVKAGATQVTVLGTKFNVFRDQGQDKISVVEGHVKVALLRQTMGIDVIYLTDGQKTICTPETLLPAAEFDSDLDLAWRDGWLRYRKTPLSLVIKDLNRYLNTPLVLIASDMANIPVTAEIKLTSDNEIVAAIEAAFGLKAVRRYNGGIELAPIGL